MARFLTTKIQISGYRMLVQRIEQGFIRRDVRLLASPFSANSTAFYLGLGLGGLGMAGMLVFSFIKPEPNRADATIVATKDGARFVMFQGSLHPVTNLASARLIAGGGDVKTVKDAEIASYPRGLLMGIPAAPDAMVPNTSDRADWTVCSQVDGSSAIELTQQQSVRTLVIVGEDAEQDKEQALSRGEALLVTEAGTHTGKKVWLLWDGYRTEVKESARALQSTLSIDGTRLAGAIPVTDAFLDAVPVRDAFAKPSMEKEGAASAAMPKHRVGTILTSSGVGEERSFLVLNTGLQQVSPFVARLFANSGSPVTNDVPSIDISNAPMATGMDFSNYPETVPSIGTSSTICYDWSKAGDANSSSSIRPLNSIPLSGDQMSMIVDLLPARGKTPQTEFFFSEPGKGWLMEVVGQEDDSLSREQLWWVSDAGIRYSISGDDENSESDTLKALGLGNVRPHKVPWSILRLLPEGNGLSISAAKVVHEAIVPEMAQSPYAAPKGLN